MTAADLAAGDEGAVDIVAIAHMLDVSTDTVRRQAKAGELPAFKVGRVWRFFPSKVRTHLEQQRDGRDPWAMPAASRRARRAA